MQKLNHANKRMSKQTMESLEQSEKRVEAAEKVRRFDLNLTATKANKIS